jgi:hypothetical protein
VELQTESVWGLLTKCLTWFRFSGWKPVKSRLSRM